MQFDDDFEDVFSGFDFFETRFMKKMRSEMEQMIKNLESGKIKGTWERRDINEPGVKGYIIQGRFGMPDSLEPLEPMKPSRRRPLPENPFELPRSALAEVREPLTDIFEEEDATRIYVELPGEEKNDIQLKFKDDCIEVKAKHFCKTIELRNKHIDNGTANTEYKNGVLQITLPKKSQLRNEDAEKERMV
jgi:HSP20 family molecular chaperone IbpA